jgi:hypothetical protein
MAAYVAANKRWEGHGFSRAATCRTNWGFSPCAAFSRDPIPKDCVTQDKLGLKPGAYFAPIGTTKVVPFPDHFLDRTSERMSRNLKQDGRCTL